MSFIYKPITHKWDILPDIEANFQSIEKEIGDAGSAKFQGWPVDSSGNYVYPNTSGTGGKPYVLPLASDKVAGGVIVGAGIVEDATGKISVTPASVGALTKAQADAAYAPITVTQGLDKATADTLYSPVGSITKADADAIYETIADAQLRNEATKQAAITAAADDADDKIAQALDDAKTYTDEAVAGIGNNQTPVIGLDRDVADALYADKATAVTKTQADTDYAPARLKTEVVKISGDQEIDGKKTFKTLPTVKIGSDPETNLATEAFVTAHAGSGSAPAYTLPKATDTVLGGVIVKADSGLEIDGDGHISVDTSSLTATVAPATKTTLGGIIVGDNLTIDANGKLSATVSNGTNVDTTAYFPNDGTINGIEAPTISISNGYGTPAWFCVGHFINIKDGAGWEVEVMGSPGKSGTWNATPPVTHNTGNQSTRSIIGIHKNSGGIETNYYHLGSSPVLLDAKIEKTLKASSLDVPLSGVSGTTVLNTLYIRVSAYTESLGLFIRKTDKPRVSNSSRFIEVGLKVADADIAAITTLTTIGQRMAIGTSQAGVSANGVDNNLYLTAGTGGEVVVNNKVLSGLADPVDPTDSVNKRYVDGLMQQVSNGSTTSSSGGATRIAKTWESMKVTKPSVNGEYIWLQSYLGNGKSHGCGWFKGITGVTSGAYPDDGGVTCRGTDFAWVRQFSDDNELTIWDFGAYGDGDNANKPESYKANGIDLDIGNKVHDDGPAMLAMWKYMSDNSRSSVYDNIGVILPAGSFGVTSIDFGSTGMFRLQGPNSEYGKMPACYIIALTPEADEPLIKVSAGTTSVSGIVFDGRAGILNDGKLRKTGIREGSSIKSWADQSGKGMKRAYVADEIAAGRQKLYGKQDIFQNLHRGAGYLNFTCVTWKNIAGKGLFWMDAIDCKFEQVYSSTTFDSVLYSTWSNTKSGAWDHATAIEITNANFQYGFMKEVLYLPRCAQSMIHNVWCEHSEYPGNITNGHWMIDSYNQEDCLNAIDARSSRVILRHLDSIDNTGYNVKAADNYDQLSAIYGGQPLAVFWFGTLTGKNPTLPYNPTSNPTGKKPSDPVLDWFGQPTYYRDSKTGATLQQFYGSDALIAKEKDGTINWATEWTKNQMDVNLNYDLGYSILGGYENGTQYSEFTGTHINGSMKYQYLSGIQLPRNPTEIKDDKGNYTGIGTDDYYVNLGYFESYDTNGSMWEIDIFTRAGGNSTTLGNSPTASGAGGMTRIKLQKVKSGKYITSYYNEGQSGILNVYTQDSRIYVKVAKDCSDAALFCRTTGKTHFYGGSNSIFHWALTVVPKDSVPNKGDRGVAGRLDFNNGSAGIGLNDTHVTMATPMGVTAPSGTPKGLIEVVINGQTVKIPYYL